MSDSTNCPNCSATLPAGATFCTSCGTRLAEPAAEAPPSPPEDATRVDTPGLHDSTQVFSPPPAAPAAPWQPAESSSPPPAPAWEAPAAPAPPAWEASPAGPASWEAPAAPAAPPWNQPPAPPNQPAPAWQQPGGAPPQQQWGGAQAPGQQWGAPPATSSSAAGTGGSPIGGLVALVGGLLTLIGLFTPWFGPDGPGESISGWDLASSDTSGLESIDPYFVLALGIGALVLGVLLFTGAARKIVRPAAIVVGLLVVVICVRDWLSVADIIRDIPGAEVKQEFGFFLTIAGGVLTAVAAVLPAKKTA